MNNTADVSNLFKIKGNWNDQMKKLQAKFPALKDVDLKFEEGKEEDLFKRLENKLDKKREEVVSILKEIQG